MLRALVECQLLSLYVRSALERGISNEQGALKKLSKELFHQVDQEGQWKSIQVVPGYIVHDPYNYLWNFPYSDLFEQPWLEALTEFDLSDLSIQLRKYDGDAGVTRRSPISVEVMLYTDPTMPLNAFEDTDECIEYVATVGRWQLRTAVIDLDPGVGPAVAIYLDERLVMAWIGGSLEMDPFVLSGLD